MHSLHPLLILEPTIARQVFKPAWALNSASASPPSTIMSTSLTSAIAVRDQLLSAGLYLADASTLNRVQWAANGRKTVLVMHSDTSSRDSEMQPAILSAILVLSKQGFFLTSDANWRGPSTISPHLSDAKASCVGAPPQVNPFRDDFAAGLTHARALQAQTSRHEDALSVGFVRDNCLKFRHVLFKVCTLSPPSTPSIHLFPACIF